MAGIRDIKRQITSVRSTQKITKAMKMVSAAKMRRANDAMMAARPYADKIKDVAVNLSMQMEEGAHPFMEAAEDVKTVAILAVNSDRGLCGSFNSNIVRSVSRFMQDHPDKSVKLYLVGKNVYDFFRKRNADIVKQWVSLGGKISYLTAQNISDQLMKAFLAGEFDELHVAYNVFRSTASQVPVVQKLLPLSFDEYMTSVGSDDDGQVLTDYIYEPASDKLLSELLPKYVTFSIYHILLESTAGEHGARMVAMDNATRSADDMLKKLTLYYNKARQAAITTDLLDIVNGAEALK
ncbi:MAG: ATP synthase F1 subunit gamma [Deferribacteraceae bacterium]|jgi:F-type H+-transporting ATPase subunit gamma|nr:ATP synthase F1 subunit gamma [Deferribacteraceae bacterium]